MAVFDNLLLNPGFETKYLTNEPIPTVWLHSASDWALKWARDNTVNRTETGIASLKKTAGNPDTSYVYQNTTLNTIVGSGGRYLISVWVLGSADLDVAPNAKIIVSAISDPNTNIAEVVSSAGLLPTTTWTQITVITPWIPKYDVLGALIGKLRIYLYCNGITTGSVWFDDASCTLVDDVKFNSMLSVPNCNATIYKPTPKECVLSVDLAGNPAYLNADLTIKSHITLSGGSRLTSSDIDAPADGIHTVTHGLVGCPDGNYTGTIELFQAGVTPAIKSDSFTFTIAQTQSPPTIYGDRYQRLAVNEVPKLFIGAYTTYVLDDSPGVNTSRAADTAKLVAAGVNVVLSYVMLFRTKTHAKLLEYLDEMDTAGINVLFNLVDCRVGAGAYRAIRWPIEGDTYTDGADNVIREMVTTYKDHPALLGWVINEEGSSDARMAEVTTAYNEIKAIDPNHPCYSSSNIAWNAPLFQFDKAALTRNIADLHAIQVYPIQHSTAVDRISIAARSLDNGIQSSRPKMQILETTIRPTTMTYTVTAPQMLCEAYQALCYGARGIIYYYWYEMLLADIAAANTAALDALTDVIVHLKKLEAIILAQDAPFQVTATAGLVLKTRMYNGEGWIIAVNPTAATIDPVFTIDVAYGIDIADLGLPGDAPTATYTVTGRTDLQPANILADGVACYRLYVDAPTPIPIRKTAFANNAMSKSVLSW